MIAEAGSKVRAPVMIAADFHLLPIEDGRADAFRRFLRFASQEAAHLYLLGDLFDVWTGPSNLRLEGYEAVFDALRESKDAGLAMTWLPGNRDFNLDPRTSASLGMEAPGDSILVDLPSGRTFLTHGDLYLSEDVAYQRLRRVLRSSPLRWLSRSLPRPVASAIASHLRARSRDAIAGKDAFVMRIVGETVDRLMSEDAVRSICGHVHRPSTFDLPSGRVLWTLGAFDEGGWYIVDDGAELRQLRFQ